MILAESDEIGLVQFRSCWQGLLPYGHRLRVDDNVTEHVIQSGIASQVLLTVHWIYFCRLDPEDVTIIADQMRVFGFLLGGWHHANLPCLG